LVYLPGENYGYRESIFHHGLFAEYYSDS